MLSSLIIRIYVDIPTVDTADGVLSFFCVSCSLRRDATFHAALQDEPLTKKWLLQLLQAVAPSEAQSLAAMIQQQQQSQQ